MPNTPPPTPNPQTGLLIEFAQLLRQEREAILTEWRAQVRELPDARHLDVPTLNDHIPGVLNEISAALLTGFEDTSPEARLKGSSPAHGFQRVDDGFDIEEVIAEYKILRVLLHDLAERYELALGGKAFQIVNRVVDGAISLAVQAYAAQRAREDRQRSEDYLTFVVHDLRTPLNAAALASRILEVHTADSLAEELAKMFEILSRNLAQLDTLISGIVEESVLIMSGESPRLERRHFDLWPLVQRIGEELGPELQGKQTKFSNTVPTDLIVYADANLLKRIFQNLIANAIDYAPGGMIELGARELPSGAGVECWISDNGSGIPPHLIDKIFDKLESDPEKDHGTGLGLAIVKTFTELHGGTVSVESEVGGGATFRIALPAKASRTPRSSVIGSPRPGPLGPPA